MDVSTLGMAAFAVLVYVSSQPAAKPKKAVPAAAPRQPSALRSALVVGASIVGVGLVLLVAKLSLVAFHLMTWTPPTVRHFDPPPVTTWKPHGSRHVADRTGTSNYSVVAFPDSFHTMHANVHNDDSLWTAAAPMFELDWVAEPDMFVAEGPTLDNVGNVYFSPLNPTEDVSLVCVDAHTGKRKWALPGKGPSYGAPLILNDPTDPVNHAGIGGGRQIVYHSTRLDAYAVDTQSGKILWHTTPNLPAIPPEYSPNHHTWGLNYHPFHDAIVGVMLGGEVFVLDRATGKPLSAPMQLPCAPATPSESARPAWWIVDRANKETDVVFGKLPSGRSLFENILEVVYGGGACVANFFAVDQNTGRIFVAATAEDAQDGKLDGFSDNGALYSLQLTPDFDSDSEHALQLEVVGSTYFHGGTGSTPSLSADGKVVYVSDDQTNVIALDAQTLETLWTLDVYEQVAASLAVAADNNELFAITQTNVIKIREIYDGNTDTPSRAEIAWIANLDAYPGVKNVNTLTPTITANGIAISMGSVIEIGGKELPTNNGMGLLDRETGNLRYFSEGREDSISVSVVDRDGAYYQAHSPVRRAASRAILGDKLEPLVGGVARFRPIRKDLLVRDAVCAASVRVENMARYMVDQDTCPPQFHDDAKQVEGLLQQAIRVEAQILLEIEQGRSDIMEYHSKQTELDTAAKWTEKVWDTNSFHAKANAKTADLSGLLHALHKACIATSDTASIDATLS